MKKLSFILTLITAVILSSCGDDDSGTSALIDDLDIDSEATLESSFEDIDIISEAGMETLDEADGGRTFMDRDALISCATVEKDTVNRMIILDFGTEGCADDAGRIRKGKITVQYNQRRLVPGAYRIVTFENFSIDEVQIEGTRTVTNTSEDFSTTPTFTSTLVGGKVTFEDETFVTREASHVRTWIRANNPLDDETRVDGGASGLKRDGIDYSVQILEQIVYKRRCRSEGVFIPVSGIKEVTWGDNVAIINYGVGSCDNEVTITLNGETFTKTVTPRGRR